MEFQSVDELNSGNHVGQELAAVEEPPVSGSVSLRLPRKSQEAEAHRVVRTGMMPWRTHQAQGRRFAGCDHTANGVASCPGRESSDLIGARTNDGVGRICFCARMRRSDNCYAGWPSNRIFPIGAKTSMD